MNGSQPEVWQIRKGTEWAGRSHCAAAEDACAGAEVRGCAPATPGAALLRGQSVLGIQGGGTQGHTPRDRRPGGGALQCPCFL